MQDDEETLETHFELTDTLFAKAAIEPVQEVYLWLGVRFSFLISILAV
jgi:hypothetical protein